MKLLALISFLTIFAQSKNPQTTISTHLLLSISSTKPKSKHWCNVATQMMMITASAAATVALAAPATTAEVNMVLRVMMNTRCVAVELKPATSKSKIH